jgi:hypothetical protein
MVKIADLQALIRKAGAKIRQRREAIRSRSDVPLAAPAGLAVMGA